jgi:hypothetical protein
MLVSNPDEDCSPQAFRIRPDELVAGPEFELEGIAAADALRDLRAGCTTRARLSRGFSGGESWWGPDAATRADADGCSSSEASKL